MVNKVLSADILAEALSEIVRAGMEAFPREACGLLTPDGQICFLTNEAEGESSYLVSGPQLEVAIQALFEIEDPGIELLEDLVIWHTHPSGFVGPSKGDLESRRQPILNEIAHLVVALPNGETAYY